MSSQRLSDVSYAPAMATTTRSASDDVLKEALEEIREMNKFIPQTLKDSKCKLCFQDGCDCEVRNLSPAPAACPFIDSFIVEQVAPDLHMP